MVTPYDHTSLWLVDTCAGEHCAIPHPPPNLARQHLRRRPLDGQLAQVHLPGSRILRKTKVRHFSNKVVVEQNIASGKVTVANSGWRY